MISDYSKQKIRISFFLPIIYQFFFSKKCLLKKKEWIQGIKECPCFLKYSYHMRHYSFRKLQWKLFWRLYKWKYNAYTLAYIFLRKNSEPSKTENIREEYFYKNIFITHIFVKCSTGCSPYRMVRYVCIFWLI